MVTNKKPATSLCFTFSYFFAGIRTLTFSVPSSTEMALSGKTAVVTGAAMGIGKAITEILLKNGAKVRVAL